MNHAGVLKDFGEIKQHVSEIIAKLDHTFLNKLDFFRDINPSSENIALYVAKELEKTINSSAVQVSRVTAWESEDACATYIC